MVIVQPLIDKILNKKFREDIIITPQKQHHHKNEYTNTFLI